MTRVTFDLLDRASVKHLVQFPPVIDHHTYSPTTPRYIQPAYALEVAILGVKDILRAVPVIDCCIIARYGHVIAASRLALNGDAYCVVFKTWAATARFLADPFQAFASGFGISHSISQLSPALLYVLNNHGLPLSPRSADSSKPSNSSVCQLQGQFDLLQQKVDAGAHAFDALSGQQNRIAQQLQDNAQTTAASIAGLSTAMTGSIRLQAATSRLDTLQSNPQSSEFLLALATPDRAPAISQRIDALHVDIAAQTGLVAQARASLSATERLLPSLLSPSAPSLTASTPNPTHIASSGQLPRTRPLDSPKPVLYSTN